MDLNTTRRIPTLVLFYYQGAGKRPAAQEKKERAALGPKGREQLNKPALYKNVVICKNRDFRVLF